MNNKEIYVKDILNICNGKLIIGNENEICENFSKDTRTINLGDVYIGIKGENFDGNLFYLDAISKGAKICIIQDIDVDLEKVKKYNDVTIIKVNDTIKTLQEIAKYKRSLYDIPVVAITGSVGKTSTKDIVARVLEEKFNVLKTEGNLNNHIGLPLTILKLKNHEALVVEMGMNNLGEISLLTNIAKPNVAVITNVGTSHIGNLGSRENILKAKLEILDGLTEDGILVINKDNDLLKKWYEENIENISSKIKTYGIKEKSDYVAYNIVGTENGSTYKIDNNNNTYNVEIKICGEHFVLNSLCAISVADIFKIPMNKIINGILKFELTKNRMEIKKKNNITIINDSYNANYDSMKAALDFLGTNKENRKIAVLGDMLELGKFSEELHKKVGGEVIKNKIDILITVGDNSKYIASSAKKGGMEEKNIFNFSNNEEAIIKIKSIMKENDVILIKASNGMKFKEIVYSILNMNKIKVGVIFGGMSTEHDVSNISGTSVIKNLNREKYEIYPIYISKDGKWFNYIKPVEEIKILQIGEEPQELDEIKNPLEYLKKLNVIFPVLHGLYGEDGTIQGLFELIKVPYVGCKLLGACNSMDKVYTKVILDKAKIKQVKYVYIRKDKDNYIYIDDEFNEITLSLSEISEKISKKINFPVFVKPSNSGSSVGVKRAMNINELKNAIEFASKYDVKILIEQGIDARELECGIIGNEDVEASCIGEILPGEEFYSYDAKYKDDNSKVVMPASITKEQEDKIRCLAIKAFKALDAKGLSRVDFFLDKNTGEIYLNEINAMPGFTQISMYPKLWEKSGIKYSELLDKLINLAM